jgi:hypothetical protein
MKTYRKTKVSKTNKEEIINLNILMPIEEIEYTIQIYWSNEGVTTPFSDVFHSEFFKS